MVLKSYYERLADSNRIPHLDMITLIKCVAIIYITVIYVSIGILIASLIDKFYSKIFKKEDDKKTNIKIITEIVTIVSTIAISTYILRNLILFVPFPLDNQYGFDYSRLNELLSGNILFGAMMLYCNILMKKVILIRNRISGNIN